MLSYGITSFTVASVRLPDIGPLSALSSEGLIKQRVRGCIVWAPEPVAVNNMAETLIAERESYATTRFSPNCIKIYLDGVPTESYTVAMFAPYVDLDNSHAREGLEKGFLLIPQNKLNEAVTRFDRQGLHAKFHAAGDAAVRAAIDAVSEAQEINGARLMGHRDKVGSIEVGMHAVTINHCHSLSHRNLRNV